MSKDSLTWYKALSIHQKINLREVCNLITGVSWDNLSHFLTMRDKIAVLYSKLKLEGFEV